jgi:hypothetical protein
MIADFNYLAAIVLQDMTIAAFGIVTGIAIVLAAVSPFRSRMLED